MVSHIRKMPPHIHRCIRYYLYIMKISPIFLIFICQYNKLIKPTNNPSRDGKCYESKLSIKIKE